MYSLEKTYQLDIRQSKSCIVQNAGTFHCDNSLKTRNPPTINIEYRCAHRKNYIRHGLVSEAAYNTMVVVKVEPHVSAVAQIGYIGVAQATVLYSSSAEVKMQSF